jgi:hypothetical protein
MRCQEHPHRFEYDRLAASDVILFDECFASVAKDDGGCIAVIQ